MKARKDIKPEYKWDFDNFDFKEEYKVAEASIKNIVNTLPRFNGKLKTADTIYELLTFLNKETFNIVRYMHYAGNLYSVDSGDIEAIKINSQLEILTTKLSQASSFVIPQLLNLSHKFLKSLLKDERFKNYNNTIKYLIKQKAHKIDEKTSQTLSKLSPIIGNESKIFNIISDSELEFEDAVDSTGKKHTLNNGTYSQLLRSCDRTLRSSAYESTAKSFKQFNKTIFNLYINSVKTDAVFCKLHNYKSVLESSLDDEDIPKTVFDNIIKYTNENLSWLQRFVKEFGKKHKLKNLEFTDLFMDDAEGVRYPISKAHKLILDALAPLGEEYISKTKYKLSDRSIDYLPNKNKHIGAYSSSDFGCKSLILLNYDYDYDSVSALIHEMGHCINAEFYNAHQPQQKAGTTIFLAEIASTVNEILLNLYMQKTSKNKLYFLEQMLTSARSSIFVQVLFSEFELFSHTQVENDVPLTQQELNDFYFNLHKKYYSNSCKLPKSVQYAWSQVPHFYTPYYVYAYATGFVTAINIVTKILNEPDFYKKYLTFLKNGTDKEPITILKEIGIDLTCDTPYKNVFKFLEEQLNKYKNS